MTRILRFAFGLAFLWLLGACASTLVTKGTKAPLDPPQEFTVHVAAFGFWSLSEPLDATAICAGRDWGSIKTVYTFPNMAIGLLTAGLYTPITAKVACQSAVR